MNFRDPESQLSGSLFSCEEINQGGRQDFPGAKRMR
jgi:hypothetical protein